MTNRFVAFLRAINVGGHVVTMARLRELFDELGLDDVETFIASGNVVFSSAKDAALLERRIEAHLQKALGYQVKTFVRSTKEVGAVAQYAPFTPARVKASKAYCVGFFAQPLDKAATAALMALQTPDDSFHVNGREIYWLARIGQGQSKFSNAVLERATKARSTFRGMNTIVRLAEKFK